jgi:prepilin-type N-terminal cleavage/methylation domain-containing protein
MALIAQKGKAAMRRQQGMSLIELMIAMVVIMVGVAGTVPLIALSMGGNGRSRQQSNSAAIAQMLTEKIASVKATTSPALTITDCTGASFTVSTTAPGGSTLLSSGAVDYTQAAVANYQMSYTNCGTGGMQTVYDVRWNITQPSTYTKLLTVSAKKQGSATDPIMFSLPVTIRTLVGQGT